MPDKIDELLKIEDEDERREAVKEEVTKMLHSMLERGLVKRTVVDGEEFFEVTEKGKLMIHEGTFKN